VNRTMLRLKYYLSGRPGAAAFQRRLALEGLSN
jgi:hypothetical protein